MSDITKQDVIEFLRKHAPDEEYVEFVMNTPSPLFGNKTPNEWGEGAVRYGWADVMGMFRKIYE